MTAQSESPDHPATTPLGSQWKIGSDSVTALALLPPGTPNAAIEQRVLERARALGAELPEGGVK